MKIGIYARGLSEKSGGSKEFILNLVKGIINIKDREDYLYIIHNSEKAFSKNNNVFEILLKSKSKIICDYLLAPKIINNLKLDVTIFPKDVLPFFIKTKRILCILDMGYYLPKYNAYKFLDNIYMKLMIRNSCQRAGKIIAISKNTKKDLISILNLDSDRIKVIYLSADNFFKRTTSNKELIKTKKRYNLNKDFIFYSGSISPRKNLIRLIKAYNRVKEKAKLDLVITGNKMWKNDQEMKLIKQNRGIKLLGYVPKEDLRGLYNLAEMYIYPSLYEGFGLPILEAQACGCPVICSNTSSLPEIAGDSAYYIDPYNEKDITDAIIKLSKNKKLKEELIKKGYKNIKRFSWNKSARDLLRVCEEVCSKK